MQSKRKKEKNYQNKIKLIFCSQTKLQQLKTNLVFQEDEDLEWGAVLAIHSGPALSSFHLTPVPKGS